MGSTPYQFDKWNCQVLINIKKYKSVENNQIILDPLGNMYEIFANLYETTTLLNLHHF